MIYLTHSRPYISFFINVVYNFMQYPRESHWKDSKHVIPYLKGTSHFSIIYSWSTDSLVIYTNYDWAGDGDDQR